MQKARWVLTVMGTLCCLVSTAQNWSISVKSTDMAFGSTIYIASAYHRAGTPAGVMDTLAGTAFLIADGDKVYLVTAKHIITAALTGKNQQLANNSILISASWKKDDRGMQLMGLSNYSLPKRPFVLSADKVDLAIISLQKSKYKSVLADLIKQECKPIPADSIDTAGHQPGESFFLPAYTVHKDLLGHKERAHGVSPGKILMYPAAGPLFKVEHYIGQGNNGAPLLLDDKIIGVLLHATGIKSNADILRNPYNTPSSGVAAKAAYILPLLRELQRNEAAAGYN